MEDVWVWDKNRPSRIIPRTEVHTTQDVTVEELKTDERASTRRCRSGSSSQRRVAAPGPMLLALDVGNTQTVVGLYDGERLPTTGATTSVRSRTADELAVELSGLLAIRGRSFADVTATVASSGVPQIAVGARRDGAHAPRRTRR